MLYHDTCRHDPGCLLGNITSAGPFVNKEERCVGRNPPLCDAVDVSVPLGTVAK